jgi:hypothetical protein
MLHVDLPAPLAQARRTRHPWPRLASQIVHENTPHPGPNPEQPATPAAAIGPCDPAAGAATGLAPIRRYTWPVRSGPHGP